MRGSLEFHKRSLITDQVGLRQSYGIPRNVPTFAISVCLGRFDVLAAARVAVTRSTFAPHPCPDGPVSCGRTLRQRNGISLTQHQHPSLPPGSDDFV